MVYDPIKNLEAQRRYRAKHREKILARQRSPAARESRKKWLGENREKCLEYQRKQRTKSKEAIAAYKKTWRLARADKVRAYNKTYHAEHREQQNLRTKIYYDANRDKLLEQGREKYAKRMSINAVRHNPEDVYRVVSRAVSAALPRFMRDDVINSMLLAVLEGELLLQNVGARMKDYLGRYNREYDSFKTLSLDAPMGGTDLKRIDLLEAPSPYEPEEDEDEDMAMLKGGYSRW